MLRRYAAGGPFRLPGEVADAVRTGTAGACLAHGRSVARPGRSPPFTSARPMWYSSRAAPARPEVAIAAALRRGWSSGPSATAISRASHRYGTGDACPREVSGSVGQGLPFSNGRPMWYSSKTNPARPEVAIAAALRRGWSSGPSATAAVVLRTGTAPATRAHGRSVAQSGGAAFSSRAESPGQASRTSRRKTTSSR